MRPGLLPIKDVPDMETFGKVNSPTTTRGDDKDGFLRPEPFIYNRLFARYLHSDIVPGHLRFS